MSLRKDPPSFGQKARLVALERMFRNLAIFLAVFSLGIAAALILMEVRSGGLGLAHPSFGGLLLATLSLILFVNAAALFFMRRFRDIQILMEKESELDLVTGISNRTGFENMLEEELHRSGRYHYPITLCYVDLDDFGALNERFGHDRGDQMLYEFAQILRRCTRYVDCIARYQKDEFCILLPHTDLAHSEKFVSRLMQEAQDKINADFSAGVTSYQAGENKAQFIMRALTALSQAKRDGKKGIRYVAGEPLAPNLNGTPRK